MLFVRMLVIETPRASFSMVLNGLSAGRLTADAYGLPLNEGNIWEDAGDAHAL